MTAKKPKGSVSNKPRGTSKARPSRPSDIGDDIWSREAQKLLDRWGFEVADGKAFCKAMIAEVDSDQRKYWTKVRIRIFQLRPKTPRPQPYKHPFVPPVNRKKGVGNGTQG